MALHHEREGNECPLCDEKLKSAHPFMVQWFRDLKKRNPLVHISWAYRGKEEQDRFFDEGKSKAKFPNSPHNVFPSKALDVFLIDHDGVARFPVPFYKKLHAENTEAKLPILWGGLFRSLPDFNHYEYKEPNGQTGSA